MEVTDVVVSVSGPRVETVMERERGQVRLQGYVGHAVG